jgi:hypothetical protein
MDFSYITEVDDLKAALGTLTGGPLALDTETYALSEWGAKGSALDCHTGGIALIILLERQQPKPLVIDYFILKESPHISEVNQLLIDTLNNAEYLIGANLKFDLKFLRKELGVWFKKLFDVVMASKLIGNATGSKVSRQLGHGYADICRELLNVHVTGKKDLRVSSWGIGIEGRTLESEWWLEKVTYAANDVRHLFPIMDIQRKVLTDPLPHTPLLETNNYVEHTGSWGLAMQETMDLEMEVVPVIAQMEYNGIPVGENTMGYFQQAIKDRLLEVGAELSIELDLDPPMKNPVTRKLEPSPKAMSILRSAQGLPKLINRGLGLKKITTGQAQVLERLLDVIDALSQFEGDEQEAAAEIFIDQDEAELYDELLSLEDSVLSDLTPVVRSILEYKKLTKQDGMDLRNFINPATKRIHASYDQLGAATGRLACIAKGQKVATVNGPVSIEELKVGDRVYCYTNEPRITTRPVTNLFNNGIREVIEVKLHYANNSLICTADHKIMLHNGDWVQAKDLKQGQQLVTGNSVSKTTILNDAVEVYDIEVADCHNYIVAGICVSNCRTPNLQQQSGRLQIPVTMPRHLLLT